ncbi:MAG: type II toxin-antitoxin system HicB family antitoxin [Eubacteriales bacterium]
MENTLYYKNYYTNVSYSAEDKILYGKIEGINDLVTFESESAETIEKEFHSAVDDYLAFCEEVGKEPEKVYKGSFNVRIAPELHKALAEYAARNGLSLNQATATAIEKFVSLH